MIQIKVFDYVNSRMSDLEIGVNKWLTENKDLEIIKIKWHHENTRFVMIVL